MSIVIDFIKKCKAPILWTIGYLFVLWLIYLTLFNFDIFNIHHWIHVSHVHLRGLGGLSFCVLTFATIPLYIATIAIVFRNQKALFTIPMPKIIDKLFSKPEPEPEKVPEQTESETIQPTNQEIDKFPAEMRGAFIHARTHPNRIATPICNVCSTNPNIYPNNDAPTQPNDTEADLPLPPDFDITDNNTPTTSSAPVFQDINLYDDDNNINTTEQNFNTQNVVTEYLTSAHCEFTVQPNGIILTNDKAIVVHIDSDFWIMDDPVWFASGKTRNSPIDALCTAAEQHKVEPVFFIGATNIMQFEEKCKEWENRGIRIVTNLSDL